jgi:hypothetical protein
MPAITESWLPITGMFTQPHQPFSCSTLRIHQRAHSTLESPAARGRPYQQLVPAVHPFFVAPSQYPVADPRFSELYLGVIVPFSAPRSLLLIL